MLKEFCAENFENIPQAIEKGAQRIELCDNLSVGGTTPSYGVIKKTVDYCDLNGATVMTMIRPRGKDFVYNELEIEIMKEDIKIAKQLGSHGVVFGCLTKMNTINHNQMKELLSLCDGMEVTFHMAFDEISKENQLDELDWLINHGVTRVLTHGGKGKDILDYEEWLTHLIRHAAGRIDILLGGGVTFENLEQLSQTFQTDQFHGTKIVQL